jgi:site-specific recombinase XerD
MKETRRLNFHWADLEMSEVELKKLIAHFALSNRSEGKSPKTEAWYTEMLSDFVRWLQYSGKGTTLAEFNVMNIREFILHMQERNLSPYTIQGHVRALKVFDSWLLNESYVPENVLARLKTPKVPNKLVEPLSQEEIEILLKARNPLTALGCRDIGILVTLLNTGLRCSELSSLDLEDAHIEEGYFKVMGKGAKERFVPIGVTTQKVLWRYVYHFRLEPNNGGPNNLFLTLEGRPLTANAIKLILQRWGKKAGVPRLHAHLCRHTYATNFLLYGCGDVFRLKQNLGHSTLEMVNRYVHYASAQVSVRNHSSAPLDKLDIKQLRGSKINKLLKNEQNNS